MVELYTCMHDNLVTVYECFQVFFLKIPAPKQLTKAGFTQFLAGFALISNNL
jgi:hypothetical protein